MFVNGRTSLNTAVVRLPMWFSSDREALAFALRALGDPPPREQHMAAIRNTLSLDRILVSEPLVREASTLDGWRVDEQAAEMEFDRAGNLPASSGARRSLKVDSVEDRSSE